jgi:hypothetical protein
MRDREGRAVAEIDRDYSNGGVMLDTEPAL